MYIISPAVSWSWHQGRTLYLTKTNLKDPTPTCLRLLLILFPTPSRKAVLKRHPPQPTPDDISNVLRLLDLPELRLEGFSNEESLRILTATQECSGDSDDEFKYFLALPKLICEAHQATEAAEKDLFESFAALEEAEDKIKAFPHELDYDDDDDYDDDNENSYEVHDGLLAHEIPALDKLTLAMREAHALAAEGREERAGLALKFLGMWLKILTPSSAVETIHKGFHEAEDLHEACEDALVEAYWLLDNHPQYEEDWDDELVWDFIRDGRTAMDLLISRGAIVISDTDTKED